MEHDTESGFCKRNLRPVYALLVVLIVATFAWAFHAKGERFANRVRGRVMGGGSTSGAIAAPAGAGAMTGAIVVPQAGAQPVNMDNQNNFNVDAVTMATPNGGIRLIGQPGGPQPWVSYGTSPTPGARMQLAAANPQMRPTFNTVCSLILPAVVSIHATRDGTIPRRPDANGAGVRFAEPFDGVPEKFAMNKAYENVGSGVIIDSRGFILTNYHVISQAMDILVTVHGRPSADYPATVVAVDPKSDLALIRVNPVTPLPEAKLGDSMSTQVGEWVLAFGSPFGLDQTVTEGIISNKRDSLVVGGISYGQMLQTDAPINRGSSGGPLVNLKAEIIGINSAIYGPNGVFSGTGFAIPVDRAKVFLAQSRNVFMN